MGFIEEPFLMDDLPAIRSLAGRSPIDIAMGEDESGRWAFAELLRSGSVDILRHDATLVGGISEWLKVAALGLARNVAIFPHWFPEIHVHLAAAYPACRGIELISPTTGIMNLHRLMTAPLAPAEGRVSVPTAPGLGIVWNRDRIEDATA